MSTQTQTTFPLDLDEWRDQWANWRTAHPELANERHNPFKGKNFLADEILGIYSVNGRTVELSEVTFPNFSDRDPKTGLLINEERRHVGITFADGETDVVRSFADLETALGLRA